MTPLDGIDEESTPGPLEPIAADSHLARIRRQSARLADETGELHLRVPRTSDPEIWVAYKPVEPAVVAKALDRRQAQAKKNKNLERSWVTLANADVAIDACVGVYFIDPDGKERALTADAGDDFPTFGDPRLAQALGLDNATRATDVCRALFATSADLVAHVGQLAELSGLDRAELTERIQGE